MVVSWSCSGGFIVRCSDHHSSGFRLNQLPVSFISVKFQLDQIEPHSVLFEDLNLFLQFVPSKGQRNSSMECIRSTTIRPHMEQSLLSQQSQNANIPSDPKPDIVLISTAKGTQFINQRDLPTKLLSMKKPNHFIPEQITDQEQTSNFIEVHLKQTTTLYLDPPKWNKKSAFPFLI